MKKFVFKSNKYNITHQDIQRGVEDRGYIDNNPITSNQTSPIDKWYKYSAQRNDTNIFPSSSVNLSRIQIHDAINRLYESLNYGQVDISSEQDIIYKVGYNFNKQKIFNLVEEQLLLDPINILTFTKDPNQFILTLAGLPIKNIIVYEGGQNLNNNTLPVLKTNTGEIVGHHKDGKFERGLQGPFTEHNVGGYKHRHQPLGTTTDRPERFQIVDNGTSLVFSSPISGASGLNYNIPYARFSREGFTKSAVNIKNIGITSINTLGNFSKNYEIVSGLSRRNQNLALVDRPQNFSIQTLDSPNISGTADFTKPDRRLLDGTYNKTVFVNKFGAPGDIRSITPIFMDQESEEYSVYNTVNYRNLSARNVLQTYSNTGSYFGGYLSGSYNVSASYYKVQRNNRMIPVSGTTEFRLRPDNKFINYQIPATDGGFSWIHNYATVGNNPGLYSNGIDNDIIFITNSIDNLGFSKISSSFYTFSGYTATIDPLEPLALRMYNIKFNGLFNFSSKQQLSNNYNKTVEYQRKNNIFTDEIFKEGSAYKQAVSVKDSAIKNKYSCTKNVYELDGVEKETLSYEFAQKYSSIVSNYYDVQENKLKNFYKDFRNISYSNKSNSLFKKLLSYDRFLKSKNISGKKIKSISHQEKIFPREQSSFRNFARIRNSYTQEWMDSLDNRLTELTNSQGQIYTNLNTINKTSTDTYKYSYWPLDADTEYTLGIMRDKSGELMQLDDISKYSTIYGHDPSLIIPSGSYYGARLNRNWNTNRPANVVHLQAGRGPYFNSYDEFSYDVRLIGQGCSILPEYRISPKLDLYYSGSITIYDDTFNSLELTGTVIEDLSLSVATSSAFLEQRVNSDIIDLNQYFNEELQEYKLSSIKFSVKAIKKLLAYDGFYPQNRMLSLAQQFSSSYAGAFSLAGANATFRTALTPMYAPGIGFNSIKAGVGMPYSVVNSSSNTVYTSITSSLSTASQYYYKMPWETILSPFKNFQEISGNIIYDVDPNMIINSTASLLSSPTYNMIYDSMANNFYSEVINFFKEDSELTTLKSKPASEWYFPDLTKKYSLDIIINKSLNSTTNTSFEGYGPKPYSFHMPPWYSTSIVNTTSSVFNSDISLAPSATYAAQSDYARIIFDPSLLSVGSSDYLVKGKFTVGDILRNSTLEYSSSTTTITGAVQISDIVDLFSVSEDGQTWLPKLKWECPTSDLNFYGLQAKLTNSSGYDHGGGNSAGDAIRGIWHQYAPISTETSGLFLTVGSKNDNRTLTGSLLDVVGFDLTQNKKIGKIKSRQEMSESLIIIPFYNDFCGEEKYFDIDIDSFEKMYEKNTGVVGEIKNISRKYVLPPSMDFIKFRENKDKKLKKSEYESVKSPFLIFPFEISSVLTNQDLADIWQGVMPSVSTNATIEVQEKEFFIGNYLKDLNFKLPDNTRFKIFKIKKRAVTNYQQIIDRTLGKNYIDMNNGYNWPYDFCSLIEMAEVKAELVYSYDVTEDSLSLDSRELNMRIGK